MSLLKVFGFLVVVSNVRGVTGANLLGANFKGNYVRGQTVHVLNGGGGQFCGDNKYKCISEAECVDGECVCPQGQHGHPQLACVSNDTFKTMVLADPKFFLYNGESSHFNIPCKNMLTHVRTEHTMGRGGGICDLKVATITHHLRQGNYLLGIDISLQITNNLRPRKSFSVNKRLIGDDMGHKYEYTEFGRSKARGMTIRWTNPTNGKFMDAQVSTTYNATDNQAMVIIEPCGLYVVFKAYVKYTMQLPGLIVFVHKKNNPSFPNHAWYLSGSPFQTGKSLMKDLKHRLRLTKEQALLYIALNQNAPQDFGVQGVACSMAITEYRRMCQTEIQKAFAIRMCSFSYIDKKISQCLNADEFGQSTGSVFALCCQAMCLEHAGLCDDVKKELALFKCETPSHFQELHCSEIREARVKMYP